MLFYVWLILLFFYFYLNAAALDSLNFFLLSVWLSLSFSANLCFNIQYWLSSSLWFQINYFSKYFFWFQNISFHLIILWIIFIFVILFCHICSSIFFSQKLRPLEKKFSWVLLYLIFLKLWTIFLFILLICGSYLLTFYLIRVCFFV